jgi:predicted transcriptional regulator
MSELKAKDLMLPLHQCATVSESATLYEAVVVLESTRKMYQRWDYRPRIALVHGDHQKILGTVRHYDILKALEPRYKEFGPLPWHPGFGLKKELVRSTYKRYEVWTDPLTDLCRAAAQVKVKDIMRIPSETEYIGLETSLGEAMHAMLLGNHPTLLVTDANGVAGILRLSDVGSYVVNEIRKSAESSRDA